MRHHNIAKLLYVQMLGYPAQWGRIECLKLVASPRFGDKRLGYLGFILLLDESQEVLTLVTNSLKKCVWLDNVAKGRALIDVSVTWTTRIFMLWTGFCTFANIASEEMSRDLCNEIEKLLGSINSYNRKKVGLRLLLPFSPLTMKFRRHCVHRGSCGKYQTCKTTLWRSQNTF